MSAAIAATAATDDDDTTGAFGVHHTITVNPLLSHDLFDDMLLMNGQHQQQQQQQQQALPPSASNNTADTLDQTAVVAATKTTTPTPTKSAQPPPLRPPSMSASPPPPPNKPPPPPSACQQRSCRVDDVDADGQPSVRPLSILLEFNQIYKDRLERVERDDADNVTQQKLHIYAEWVHSLIAQNTDLITAFEQIEAEACQRLRLTEGRRTADRSAHDATLARAQSDVRNLVELLRRVREERRWDGAGLVFYDVPEADIVGVQGRGAAEHRETGDHNQLLQRLDIADTDAQRDERLDALAKENSLLADKCKRLESQLSHQKQASVDAHALVLEVAEKHDAICKFRNEMARLEEQLKQKDLHVYFKDKIIRDLRREIKKSTQLQRSTTAIGPAVNNNINNNTSSDSTGSPMQSLANGNGNGMQQQQHQQRTPSGSDETHSGDEKPQPPSSAADRHQHQNDTLHTLNQEWSALHEQLAHKDAAIERQQRRLDELNGMRELVSAFRADLERLQCFEQQRGGGQTRDSTQTLCGLDKSSGFLSAESILCSLNGSRLVTPDQTEQQTNSSSGDGSEARMDVVAEGADGAPLVMGVQRLMQDMCTHIASLTAENVNLSRLLSERGSLNNGGGGGLVAIGDQQEESLSLAELRRTFGDFVLDIASMMDMRLPDSRSQLATKPAVLDAMRRDLSSTLAGRDRLLQERADEIVALRDQLHRLQQQQSKQHSGAAGQLAGLERELFESKKQLARLETQSHQTSSTTQAELAELTEKWRSAQTELAAVQQQLAAQRSAQTDGWRAERQRGEAELAEVRARAEKSVRFEREQGMQAIEDLQKAVSYHVDTIGKLQADRSAQDAEIQQLQNLIAAHHEADQALVDKQFRLENECKHQLITISNLRTALEAGSKQRSSSVAHSAAVSGGHSSAASASTAPPSVASSSVSSSAAAAAAASSASSPVAASASAAAAASATTVTANTSGNTNANTNPTAINTSTHAASSLWNWWRNVHEV